MSRLRDGSVTEHTVSILSGELAKRRVDRKIKNRSDSNVHFGGSEMCRFCGDGRDEDEVKGREAIVGGVELVE